MSNAKKGNKWDPSTYVYNYPYNTDHYYSFAPRRTAFEIPGAIKWANISLILSILGIIIPVYVFTWLSITSIKKYNKISYGAKLGRINIAKRLNLVGGILSILLILPIAMLIIRFFLVHAG